MVRTAARASILALLRLDGATIRDAVEDAFDRLFAPVLSRMLQAAWIESVNGLEAFQELCPSPGTRESATETCDELQSYVQDLLMLDQPAITRALALHLDEEVMTWAMPVGSAVESRARTWRNLTTAIQHHTLTWGAAMALTSMRQQEEEQI